MARVDKHYAVITRVVLSTLLEGHQVGHHIG